MCPMTADTTFCSRLPFDMRVVNCLAPSPCCYLFIFKGAQQDTEEQESTIITATHGVRLSLPDLLPERPFGIPR